MGTRRCTVGLRVVIERSERDGIRIHRDPRVGDVGRSRSADRCGGRCCRYLGRRRCRPCRRSRRSRRSHRRDRRQRLGSRRGEPAGAPPPSGGRAFAQTGGQLAVGVVRGGALRCAEGGRGALPVALARRGGAGPADGARPVGVAATAGVVATVGTLLRARRRVQSTPHGPHRTRSVRPAGRIAGRRVTRAAVVLAAEPAGFVVDRDDRHRRAREVPGRSAPTTSRGERHLDRPLPVLGAPGIPVDVVERDAALLEPLVDPLPQRHRVQGTGGRHVGAARELGDVLALGEDRTFVAVHLLHRPAGPLGRLGGARPGADHRLHLDRAQRLGGPAVIDVLPTEHGAQGVVDRQAELRAGTVGEQHVLAVLVDADEVQIGHKFSRSLRRPRHRQLRAGRIGRRSDAG